mgnify:FL=1|nr:antibiotic biosynthesis monooxygenase family protein [uncultured Acidocella sp.]
MVTEFADILVKPGMEQDFIAGAEKSKPLFLAAKGCHGMSVQRLVEEPTRFVLLVQWESVAAHEAFRATAAFTQWRANVSACFEKPPQVWHGEVVI